MDIETCNKLVSYITIYTQLIRVHICIWIQIAFNNANHHIYKITNVCLSVRNGSGHR